MGQETDIQWCDDTVNPVMGCDGCELWLPKTGVRICYAGRLHETRGKSNKGFARVFDEPTMFPGRTAKAARWSDLTGKDRADKPWLQAMPRLIFVSDMGDAPSKEIPFDYLQQEIIAVAASDHGRRHIWQWLTKQPGRMCEFSSWLSERGVAWPENVWAGTSVTSTKTLNRVPALLRVGGATTVRFLSVEPQWDEIDLTPWLPALGWIIQGGQSGKDARPFDLSWARALRNRCKDAGVPYFLKQLGAHVLDAGSRLRLRDHHGGDWDEWPSDLRVRELPGPRVETVEATVVNTGAETPAPAITVHVRLPMYPDGLPSGDDDRLGASKRDTSTGGAGGGSEDADVDSLASYEPKHPSLDGAPEPSTPTREQYERFQALHGYFNGKLGLNLQPAMLAFSRKAKTFGYFAARRWRKDTEEEGRVGEIALNPDCLSHEPREIAATIVHEMCHQWQHEHGFKKSRSGYHNAEWAAKMEFIGLMPSSTGAPGGKKTGGKMSDYVIEGGQFALAFAALPAGSLLPFVSGSPTVKGVLPPGPPKPKDPSKTKYTCVACSLNAWAKPGADLMHCGKIMAVA